MKPHRSWTTIGALAVAAWLAGCAIAPEDEGEFRTLSEDRGELVIGADAFVGFTPTRVEFRDFIQREEYVLYRSAQGQAEFLYLRARTESKEFSTLEFKTLVSETLALWSFNRDHTLTFEGSYNLDTELSRIWVQPYRHEDTGRQCVGAVSSWDVGDLDPGNRPRKALFGYYCLPIGQDLSAQERDAFVKSIGVRGITLPLQIKSAYDLQKEAPPTPPKAQQIASMVSAQNGIAGGVAGLPRFPVLSGRIYTPSKDRCWSGC